MVEKQAGKNKKKSKKGLLITFVLISLLLIPAVYFIGQYLDSRPISIQKKTEAIEDHFEYLVDFETNRYLTNSSAVTTEKFLSGKKSGKLDGYKSFSPGINIPIPTDDTTDIDGLNVKFWINPPTKNLNVSLVFSVLDQNKNQIHWDGYNISKGDLIANNWQAFQHRFDFPAELISTSNTIKVYLWQLDESNNVLYVDDISIGFNENFIAESPRSKFVDFEDGKGNNISSKYSRSGFYSTFAKGADGFSGAVKIPMSELKYENLSSISYSFHYLSETPSIDAAFVFSITDSMGNDVHWQSTHLKFENHQTGEWEIGNGNAIIPTVAIDSSNIIKLYLWNRNDNIIYIDDIYMVVKESDGSSEGVEPAADFLNTNDFERKTNHPPYEFVYLKNYQLSDKHISELHKVFTKSKKSLVGNFDKETKSDEILAIYSNEAYLMSLEGQNIEYAKVDFTPVIKSLSLIFSDEGLVFVGDKNANELIAYSFNGDGFVLHSKIEGLDLGKMLDVSYNSDNSISVFESNGKVVTYIPSDDGYKYASKQVIVNTEFGNIKYLRGNFLGDSKQMLVLYLQGSQDSYKLYEYSKSLRGWGLSNLHSNKSSQSFDKLKFNDSYYVCNSDLSSDAELFKFSRSPKFDFKMFNLNKMSYEILNNIDFVGFPSNQNPKYYEVNKVLCGDFVEDGKTEVIIFQDNLHNVDWLPQKVEMYCFE